MTIQPIHNAELCHQIDKIQLWNRNSFLSKSSTKTNKIVGIIIVNDIQYVR